MKHRKICKWLLLLLLAVTAVVMAMISWLLTTTQGARFAFDHAKTLANPNVILEGEIQSGDLANGFTTEGAFKVEVPEVVLVKADKISISYSLWNYLTTGTLVITKLNAPTLRVELNDEVFAPSEKSLESKEETAASSEEPFRLNIPVRAVVRHLISQHFAFTSQIVDVLVDDLDLSASCNGDYAGVTGGKLSGVLVHLKLPQSVDDEPKVTPDPPREEILKAGFGGEQLGIFPTIDLPLDTEIRKLLVLNGRYYMDGFDTGEFDAYVDAGWLGHVLDVKRVAVSHAWGKAAVTGEMDFKDHFGLNFDLGYHGSSSKENCQQFGGLLCDLEGRGQVRGSLADLRFMLDAVAPQPVKLAGRLNALSHNMPFEVSADSPVLRYPLFLPEEGAGAYARMQVSDEQLGSGSKGDPDAPKAMATYVNIPANAQGILVRELKASLKGSLTGALKAKVAGQVTGYGFEELKIALDVDTAISALNNDSLTAQGEYFGSLFDLEVTGDLMGGSVLEGFLDPYLGFDGDVSFSSKDAKGFTSYLAGMATVNTHVSLGMSSYQNFAVGLEDLLARLQLNGQGSEISCEELSWAEDVITLQKFFFAQGNNGAEISGQLSENSDLIGKIELNSLATLIPGMQGTLNGRFKLRNDYRAPNLELLLKSEALSFNDTKISGFKVNGLYDATRERGGITVIADRLRFTEGMQESRKCALDLQGSLPSHSLTVNCGGRNRGFLALEGQYDQDSSQWHGMLRDLLLESEFSDPISLSSRTTIDYDVASGDGVIAPFRLENRNRGSLSFERSVFKDGRLKTRFSLRDLDLKAFSEFYSDSFRASGMLSADVQLEALGGDPKIDADLKLNRGRLFTEGAFFAFKDFNAQASMLADTITLGLDAKLMRDFGKITADLRLKDPTGLKVLSGKVSLDAFNLGILGGVGEGFNELKGTADAALELKGTLTDPKIYGTLKLNGSAEPRYDIGRIGSFNLQLLAQGSSGELTGQFEVNEGALELAGMLDWSQGAHGNLHVTAEDMPVFLMGYGSCLTDLDVQASLDEILKVSGIVSVPVADLRVQSLGDSALMPSKDEVVIGKQGGSALLTEHRQRQQNFKSQMDILFSLGDKVKLEAMGLKAGVTGAVRIHKDVNDAVPQGEGKVSLVDGRADLYGHRFLVSYADTIFNGNITDPKIISSVYRGTSSLIVIMTKLPIQSNSKL